MVEGMRVSALRAVVRATRKLHLEVSFSQEGEDRILVRLFEDRSTGFYVDVGALHPVRFSNTLLLYLQGWRGVNIDATPGSMRRFRRLRRRDINLEVAIGKESGVANFYLFNESALNTFDVILAEERRAAGWELSDIVPIRLRPLSEVWAESVPQGVVVDLLTVDVEGRDVEVLESLDWSRQRPRIVCVEQLVGSTHEQSVDTLLVDHGYELVGRTINTVLYGSVSADP